TRNHPAHNLSDAIGFDNLYTVETFDSSNSVSVPHFLCVVHACGLDANLVVGHSDQNGMVGSMIQDLAFAIPGVDGV
ncbi:hypothetical protein EDC04DRAFT_2717354, partial [Pisolithus marmoratus]